MSAATFLLCVVAVVTDGDSLRCMDGTRLRLAGIDAPELHACRRGRVCAPGDPRAARRSLDALTGSSVRYRVIDADPCRAGFQWTDHYGRTVAVVWSRGRDLSAEQLRRGHAVRWEAGCR